MSSPLCTIIDHTPPWTPTRGPTEIVLLQGLRVIKSCCFSSSALATPPAVSPLCLASHLLSYSPPPHLLQTSRCCHCSCIQVGVHQGASGWDRDRNIAGGDGRGSHDTGSDQPGSQPPVLGSDLHGSGISRGPVAAPPRAHAGLQVQGKRANNNAIAFCRTLFWPCVLAREFACTQP